MCVRAERMAARDGRPRALAVGAPAGIGWGGAEPVRRVGPRPLAASARPGQPVAAVAVVCGRAV